MPPSSIVYTDFMGNLFGFDKEIADIGTATHAAAGSPRYPPPPDLPPRSSGPPRSDDLDVPTFIRKKAD